MNGYFRLVIDEKGTSVELIPPFDGGEAIRSYELKEYLDQAKVPYDTMAINSALYSLGEERVVLFLSSQQAEPVKEFCTVSIESDKMTATMRLFPASNNGSEMTTGDVVEVFAKSNIKAGLDDAAITNALLEKQYCTDIIVAKGKLPTAGRDAKIKYYFDVNNAARPELKEDGSVDFFKLNTLHHCTEGQVLAEIIPEEQGANGFDIFGNVHLAREVKKAKFDHGRNLQISEDGLKLMSMVNGHASLVDGAVFVSDVYTVEDVGPSTGNIEYHGTVEVKGNVCENFSVRTKGDVIVNGVVEGAIIEAGGNIIIARGMHGQNKGKLVAGGNIIAKFISAADVTASGFVEAEQILNANVVAGTEVHAEAGKGLVNGGKIVASKAVNLKNAGSPMGSMTIIEVGCDAELRKKAALMQKDVAERSKNIQQNTAVLTALLQKMKAGTRLSQEQLGNMKVLQKALQDDKAKLTEELEELQSLEEATKFDSNAHIDVRGVMYQGVAVTISGVNMTVKSDYTFCRLVKEGADIVSTNI